MRQVGSRGEPTGIAVDSAGSVYLAGNFRGILRSDDSLIQQPQQGAALTNGFVARLSATGQWRWATPITEMAYEGMGPLTLDAAGQPVVFGGTYGGSQFGDGTVIPVGTGPGFLGRLTTSGQWLSVLLFGDGAWINPRALATDSAGRFYLGGEYAGTPTFGTHTLPGTGGSVTTPSFFVASFRPCAERVALGHGRRNRWGQPSQYAADPGRGARRRPRVRRRAGRRHGRPVR